MKTLIFFLICLLGSFSVEASSFISETMALTPLSFQETIKKDIKVEFVKLDDYEELQNPCETRAKPQVYGKVRGRRIFLNKNFLPYLEAAEDIVHFECGHKNFKKLARATLIHEMAHIFDNVKNVSSDPWYLQLSHSKKNILGISQAKNRKTERLPDAYELKNPAEHFAVNTEFFMLDPEYACRRPNMAKYLAKVFEVQVPSCKGSSKVRIFDGFRTFEQEISPHNIESIHYLLADKGSAAMSRFGHSMFLLKTNDTKTDLVVGFSGQMEGTVIDGLKGLTGKYASRLIISPFNKIRKSYTKDQLRGLNSYPISMSEEEKESFLNEVLTLYWEYSGRYYFFTNNCATEALDLLKTSLLNNKLMNKEVLSPLGLRKVLLREGLISEETKTYFPSNIELLEKVFSRIKGLSEGMKLEDYLNLSASERALLITETKFEKTSLYALLSFELTFSARENLDIEKKMLLTIHKLPENDPIKTVARRAVGLSNGLTFGFNIAEGYGIPKEEDFISGMEEELRSMEEELAKEFGKMGEWVKEYLGETLSEVKTIEKNVSLIQSKIKGELN